MREETGRTVALEQGCRQRLHMSAGTMVLLRRGRLRLRGGMEWLGGQCVRVEQTLAAEETYTALADGWVELEAESPVEFLVLKTSAPTRRSWWHRWLGKRTYAI